MAAESVQRCQISRLCKINGGKCQAYICLSQLVCTVLNVAIQRPFLAVETDSKSNQNSTQGCQRTAQILQKYSDPKHQIGTVLYCAILHCTVLSCTDLYCTVLYCTVLYCTVRYCTALYYTVLYCPALYCPVLICTVPYCTALYCTALYCAYQVVLKER